MILSDDDVASVLNMREAIESVEMSFGELEKGSVVMPQRSTIMLETFGGSISYMPSYIEKLGALAAKIISIYPRNPTRGLPTSSAWIIVNDPETGKIESLMDATYLTAVRTGAVTGVAARYLAPKGSKTAAVIGCGVQGRMQAWALAETLDLDYIRIFDISRENMRRFAEEMKSKLCIEIQLSESGKNAVKNADVIATATTSKTPVIERSWLGSEVHLSSVGSFYPDHRELDADTVRDAKIVVDSREAALAEAGDILIPISEGIITKDHIYAELGELVLGRKAGRVKGDGITIFKSVGLAIQDSSVASLVLKRWRETNLS